MVFDFLLAILGKIVFFTGAIGNKSSFAKPLSKEQEEYYLKLVEQGDNEAFEALSGMECYECGSCTYVCPAGRRLTQAFRQTRRAVLDARRKK